MPGASRVSICESCNTFLQQTRPKISIKQGDTKLFLMYAKNAKNQSIGYVLLAGKRKCFHYHFLLLRYTSFNERTNQGKYEEKEVRREKFCTGNVMSGKSDETLSNSILQIMLLNPNLVPRTSSRLGDEID